MKLLQTLEPAQQETEVDSSAALLDQEAPDDQIVLQVADIDVDNDLYETKND